MKQIHKNLLCALSLAASLLPASAEGTFEKIAFMGDNVEINGSAIGWDATDPAVVDVNPATGKFEFTARFTRQRSLWQMYTDAIGENDWGPIKQSIHTPNMFVAFLDMDPEPEDIVINDGGVDCFNIKYLSEAVGQTVPVYPDPDGGFWVGGGSSLTTDKVFSFEISADLSEMKIVSVKDAEVNTDFPEYLYLLGDATPGGWELDKATRMENLGDGIYRYVGELKAGEPGAMQIYAENPAICGTDAMAYGPSEPQVISSWGVSNSTLKFYETDRPSGCYYQVQEGETNDYIVTVDIVNKSINVVVDNLYFVGVPTDWGFVQMEKKGNRVYTYKGHFAAGSAFCFTATQGWGTKVAPGLDANFGLAKFSDNTLMLGSQCAMSNIYDGYYEISADLNNFVLTTRTYNPDPITNLYVAANGTYTALTDRGDGIYYWVGDLNGDFTITTGETEYPCYMPAEEITTVPEDGIIGTEMVYNTIAANGLNKWRNDNTGVYTVKVDPTAMTVSIEKGDTSGVAAISIDDKNVPVVFYDLMGRKVQNPTKGIYVKVQGDKAQKVVIR